MKKLKLAGLLILFSFIFAQLFSVSAQGFCDIFPCDITDQGLIDNTRPIAEQLIQFGIDIVFLVIIIFGIFKVITGALKIIRSEGDSGKIEEGSKTLQNVIVGIAIIFIGVIGLVVVSAIFGAGGIFQTNPGQNEPGVLDLPLIE